MTFPDCAKQKKTSRIPQRNGDSRTKAGSRQDDTAVTCSSSKDLFKKINTAMMRCGKGTGKLNERAPHG